MKQNIINKLKGKDLVIGVMGLGYVGLPLAIECANNGFQTYGIDVSKEKVIELLKGNSYVDDISNTELQAVLNSKVFHPTNEVSVVEKIDVIFICVPTPLDYHQQPDTNYIQEAGESIAKYLTKESVIILESTTYPGTTRELLCPILETSGLQHAKDFYLGFSPERVDPGNDTFSIKNTPKVVGAMSEDGLDVIAMIYESILEQSIHKVSSPEIAEMEKILENTYRNINIGLVNELTILCDRLGISIWEVVDAAKTKPYGFQAFYPGPGLGGHCIPLDPYYLTWKAREFGFHTSMIENSMEINDYMPEYTVQRISRILNQHRKPLNGTRVLLLGMAYKKNISDYRESPALDVFHLLQKEQASVDYYDPYIMSFNHLNETYEGVKTLNKEVLESYDIVVITTAHQNVDYEFVAQHANFIFDTRNATKDVEDKTNIELL